MGDLDQLSSGILGFDAIVTGGLVAGASYIIQGKLESGKILANRIAFHQAAMDRKVLSATLLAKATSGCSSSCPPSASSTGDGRRRSAVPQRARHTRHRGL